MKPRKTLRVAVWEVRKSVGDVSRRTLVIGAVALVLVAAGVPLLAQEGVDIDEGIYRVGVSEDSRYYDVVTNASSLAAHEPSRDALERGRIDVLVQDGRVYVIRSQKGRAAAAALRRATQRYNTYLMRLEEQEGNEAAAFPVTVELVYFEQTGEASDGGDGGTTNRSAGGGGAGGGGPGGGGDGDDDGDDGESAGGVRLPSSPSLGGGLLPGNQQADTPSGITPPFPFESLVLAFVFVLPMNFVVQAYSSSIINERINRRGELLLVSPVSRFDIIAGKTLPYLAAMLGISSAIALGIRGGIVSVAAVVPVALVFLALAFVGAMFSRSFKELTFVTVSISVLVTTYVFVPAIFTEIHPIASISPITLVVRDLQGTAVSLGDYAFSTLPLYLTSGVLFALGAGVYREEDMFTQRSVPLKTLDAVASQVHRRASVAKLSVLFIPFVFAAELLTLATLFAIPLQLSMPVLLLSVALIEEVAKSVQVYAGYAHSVFERTWRNALVLGFLSGLGFFVGEKLTLLTQIVGIPELRPGRLTFGVQALPFEPSPLAVLALLLAPLALHVVTASITSLGATYGKREYAVALVVAVVVHAAYNFTVVTTFG